MWIARLFRRRVMEPPRPVCRWSDARVMCGERRAAQRAGEMFWSVHYGGWIYPAEDRHVPHSLTRECHAPFTWRWCPFCGGALPDATTVVRRMLQDEDDSPYADDEEGD